MTTNITINEINRPFCVGMGALIEFEKRTGKNFLNMVGDTGLSLSDIGTIAYCCFLVGARAHKQNFDIEEYEVIDWIDQHIGFQKVTKMITEGLGKQGLLATEETAKEAPSISEK